MHYNSPRNLTSAAAGAGAPSPPRPKLAVQSEPQPSVFRTGPDKGANFASRGEGPQHGGTCGVSAGGKLSFVGSGSSFGGCWLLCSLRLEASIHGAHGTARHSGSRLGRRAPRQQGLARHMPQTSFSRCTPFARGKIVGKAEVGVSTEHIRTAVRKKDGTFGSNQAIRDVVAKAKSDPAWQGQDSSAGGRPQRLSAAEVRALKQLIHEEVGVARVTIPYCRKRLPWLKRVSAETVRRTLHRLGLAWRLRRNKAAVSKKYRPARRSYCRWVERQPRRDLLRWAYVDGTSFYLARTPEEHEDKQRASLGKHVWRLQTGQDSLEEKHVGASSYAKAQGLAIKIWGFFCDGRLEYYVLPKGIHEQGESDNAAHERQALPAHGAHKVREVAPALLAARPGLHREGLRALLAPPSHGRGRSRGRLRSHRAVPKVLAGLQRHRGLVAQVEAVLGGTGTCGEGKPRQLLAAPASSRRCSEQAVPQ